MRHRVMIGSKAVRLWALLLLFMPSLSNALLIRIEPESRTVPVGNTFSLNIFASDFDNLAPGDLASPPLGEFSLLMRFDRNAVQFDSYTLSNEFGNLSQGEVFDTSTGLLPPDPDPLNTGVNLGARSRLSREELALLQSTEEVLLARISFSLIDETVSYLRTTSVDLYDASGRAFITSVSEAEASIRPAHAAVPAPPAILLFVTGLLVLTGTRLIRRKTQAVSGPHIKVGPLAA